MLIYFGVFAVITVWCFRQPAAAVGALLCTYGVEQWSQSQNAFFWTHMWLTNFMTAGVLIMALCFRFARGKTVITPLTRDYWATVAIYALAVTSVIWSVIPAESWNQFSIYIKYIVVFAFMMPLAIVDKEDLRVTLYTLLTLGTGVCLLLMLDSTWDSRKIVFKSGAAIGAIGLERGNPLAVATLGGQIALAAWLMNFRGVARFWQIFRYAVIGIGFALAVRSGSRGQTFALVLPALPFTHYIRRFRDLRGFLGFVVSMVFFTGVMLFVFETITRATSSADVSYNEARWSWDSFVEAYEGGRVNTSLILLNAWVSGGPLRWILGIGSSGSFDPGICGMYPHVVFTEVLGELGLVGWVILWLIPIYAFQNLRTLWHFVKDDPEERGLIAAWAGIFLFDVILSFKQGSLLGCSSTFGMAIILGRVAWSYKQEAAMLEQLDAGGYAMTPTDWDATGEDERDDSVRDPRLGGVAMN